MSAISAKNFDCPDICPVTRNRFLVSSLLKRVNGQSSCSPRGYKAGNFLPAFFILTSPHKSLFRWSFDVNFLKTNDLRIISLSNSCISRIQTYPPVSAWSGKKNGKDFFGAFLRCPGSVNPAIAKHRPPRKKLKTCRNIGA